MAGLVFYISLPILLLLITLASLFRDHKPTRRDNQALTVDDFLPIHYRKFEEVERSLSQCDAMLQQIRTHRRVTALTYLRALRTDFTHVEALLNHCTKLLPELTVREEWERLRVRLKFRLEYRIVQLEIFVGVIPAVRLQHMTRKVRILADRADQALNTIAREHGIRVLQSNLNT